MKNKIVLFITGCISLMLISCLDSDNDYESIVIRDAQIKTMVLSHDSISGLSDVVFTIDQVNGRIFNKDSMPYGTEVAMVVCTLTYVTGVAGTQVTQEAIPDSTYYWNGTDSLDFSKPVKFVTTAYDGSTTKTYTAQLNIHTVVPDSMAWELYVNNMLGKTVNEQKVIRTQYKGEDVYFMYVNSPEGCQLYYSPVTDVKKWEEIPVAGVSPGMLISRITEFEDILYMTSAEGGLYQSVDGVTWSRTASDLSFKYLLGAFPAGRNSSGMAAIVNNEDILYFAGMNSDGEWTVGNAVPDKFPITGFACISYENMYYGYLSVVGGRTQNNQLTNATWSTTTGLQWTLLSSENVSSFEGREGMMLSKYDDKFCLIGGIDARGNASKELYFSTDFGVTWKRSDELVVLPGNFAGRGFSSVMVDDNNYMLLFGGKVSQSAKPVDEIWRGRINRLGF